METEESTVQNEAGEASCNRDLQKQLEWLKQLHERYPLHDQRTFLLDLQKYKYIFQHAPDAIFIADTQSGFILDANDMAAELLKMPRDQIIGMHQSQLHLLEGD